ncbi:hypothetical protein Scep_029667 [Stephania cephalantha]|uniref:Uncharacterized protein n=1 Tax=Stephania cephalantha TaxID=152367 RepID=A0AAP0DYA6_9MAGN
MSPPSFGSGGGDAVVHIRLRHGGARLWKRFWHVAAADWWRELKTADMSRADRLDLLLVTLCVREGSTRGSKEAVKKLAQSRAKIWESAPVHMPRMIESS